MALDYCENASFGMNSCFFRLVWRMLTGVVGWLATGDANLNAKSRRAAFQRHYAQVIEFVGTFGLPHHGSKHNFHEELNLRHPALFFVSAGENNSYGHPHEEVTHALDRPVWITTEQPATILREEIQING